jgi:hypothetical protein
VRPTPVTRYLSLAPPPHHPQPRLSLPPAHSPTSSSHAEDRLDARGEGEGERLDVLLFGSMSPRREALGAMLRAAGLVRPPPPSRGVGRESDKWWGLHGR